MSAIADWFKGFFRKKPDGVDVCVSATDDFVGAHLRQLAFWSAVNFISRAISKCEFQTFARGEKKRTAEHYLWNVQPNKNESAVRFRSRLIAKLYSDNEVLVVQNDKELHIADDFEKTERPLLGDLFHDVRIGEAVLPSVYTSDEVLYFKLSDKNIKNYLDGIIGAFSSILNYGASAYKRSRGTKGVFKYETLPVAGTEARQFFDDLVQKKMSAWLSSDNAALPLGRGQDFEELKGKTYSNESTRDIRALVDDVIDFTANAFGIPAVLLRGDVAGTAEAINNFIAFCIEPLAALLSAEINRKRYRQNDFLRGDYIKIDTSRIKHTDILGAAVSIEKLIGSGAFSVNGVMRLLGLPEITEDWADEHFITKNFSLLTDEVNGAGGGENE